jgi:peptidoglycan biosynthesis protein MviN/MurJ (putative lipid II flippase)
LVVLLAAVLVYKVYQLLVGLVEVALAAVLMPRLQVHKVVMAVFHLAVVQVVAQVLQLVEQVVKVRQAKLECGAGNDT